MLVTDKIDPRKVAEMEKGILSEYIIYFASVGDLAALKRLKFSDINLNINDYDKRTPLHLAATNGNIEVVEYFIE